MTTKIRHANGIVLGEIMPRSLRGDVKLGEEVPDENELVDHSDEASILNDGDGTPRCVKEALDDVSDARVDLHRDGIAHVAVNRLLGDSFDTREQQLPVVDEKCRVVQLIEIAREQAAEKVVVRKHAGDPTVISEDGNRGCPCGKKDTCCCQERRSSAH